MESMAAVRRFTSSESDMVADGEVSTVISGEMEAITSREES